MAGAVPIAGELRDGWLPLNLRLAGRAVLVVGGGPVAQRKIRTLLQAGARVQVVALSAAPAAMAGQVDWQQRAFSSEDVAGATLVVAATNDGDTNRSVAAAARSVGVPINVADAPDACDVTLPAVLRRGPLTVAVTTGARSPALARRLRREIAALIGPEYGWLAELLAEARRHMKSLAPQDSRFADSRARNRIAGALAESELLEALGARDAARADALLAELLGPDFDLKRLGFDPPPWEDAA